MSCPADSVLWHHGVLETLMEMTKGRWGDLGPWKDPFCSPRHVVGYIGCWFHYEEVLSECRWQAKAETLRILIPVFIEPPTWRSLSLVIWSNLCSFHDASIRLISLLPFFMARENWIGERLTEWPKFLLLMNDGNAFQTKIWQIINLCTYQCALFKFLKIF